MANHSRGVVTFLLVSALMALASTSSRAADDPFWNSAPTPNWRPKSASCTAKQCSGDGPRVCVMLFGGAQGTLVSIAAYERAAAR